MTTTPNKSNPKRSPVSPGFAPRVVNSMTSPLENFKKCFKPLLKH